MDHLPEELKARMQRVRLIALDVDGVMTDGKLIYLPDGAVLPSGFHVHDGLGIRVAIESGLKVVFISGNWTDSVRLRAEHLKVSAHYLGVGDKVEVMHQVSKEFGLDFEEFAYVGDDLNDLGPLKMAGLAVSVADGTEEVRSVADYICERKGGAGAVREIVEIILKEQGLWQSAMERFMTQIEKDGFQGWAAQ